MASRLAESLRNGQLVWITYKKINNVWWRKNFKASPAIMKELGKEAVKLKKQKKFYNQNKAQRQYVLDKMRIFSILESHNLEGGETQVLGNNEWICKIIMHEKKQKHSSRGS